MPGHQLCLITVLLILHMFTSGCSGFIIHRRQNRDTSVVDDGLNSVKNLRNLLSQRIEEQQARERQQQDHTNPTQTELPDKRHYRPDFGILSRSQAGDDVSRGLLARVFAQDPYSYGRRKREAELFPDMKSLLQRPVLGYASDRKSQPSHNGSADLKPNMASELHKDDVNIITNRALHRRKADDNETELPARRIADDNSDKDYPGKARQKTAPPTNSVSDGMT